MASITHSRLRVEVLQDSVRQFNEDGEEEEWVMGRMLGVGGQGQVYLQRSAQYTWKVRAVKKLNKGEGMNQNWEREIKAATFFSQDEFRQFFAQSYGWYEWRDSTFLTMEYAPCGDLDNCMDYPIEEHHARAIVKQVLRGLQIMHENNFTHRDLNLKNVLVFAQDPQWIVKIADFGIGKSAGTADHTALRTKLGTAGLTAPDILYGRSNYTSAVDLWSMGALTFALLSGNRDGLDAGACAKFYYGVDDAPFDNRANCFANPQAVEFLRLLLSRDASERPSAAEALTHIWLNTGQSESEMQPPGLLPPQQPWSPVSNAWTSTSFDGFLSAPQETRIVLWRPPPPSTPDETSPPLSAMNPLVPLPPPPPPPPLTSDMMLYLPIRKSASRNCNREQSCDREQPGDAIYQCRSDRRSRSSSWKEPNTIRSHQRDVTAVAFSARGDYFATGSIDTVVRIWATRDQQLEHSINIPSGAVTCLAFSPNGDRLAIRSEHHLLLYSLNQKRLYSDLEIVSDYSSVRHEAFGDVCFSPDGLYVATSSVFGGGKLLLAETGALLKTLRPVFTIVVSMAFSHDGKYVVGGLIDHRVKIWSLRTLQEVVTLGARGREWCSRVLCSSKGDIAMLADQGTLKIWDPEFKPIQKTGKVGEAYDMAFSPDGSLVAVGYVEGDVGIWGKMSRAGRRPLRFLHFGEVVERVCFSPNGHYLAGCGPTTLIIWDAYDWNVVFSSTDGPFGDNFRIAVAFSPDDRFLIRTMKEGDVELLDLQAPQFSRERSPGPRLIEPPSTQRRPLGDTVDFGQFRRPESRPQRL